MRHFLFTCLLAAPLGAGLACQVQAAAVTAKPATIAMALQSAGLPATQSSDDYGDPMIDSKINGTNFTVYFYGCKQSKGCHTIQFSTGYDLDTPMNATKINEWNRDNRFGRAYLDDQGDPFIEMDINLDGGGVAQDNFDASLGLWKTVTSDFEKFINW